MVAPVYCRHCGHAFTESDRTEPADGDLSDLACPQCWRTTFVCHCCGEDFLEGVERDWGCDDEEGFRV